MKKIELFIGKMNFKKAAVIYLITAIIAVIISAGFLGYIFRNKLTFSFEYNKVSEKVENNNSGVNAVKPDLTHLANQSSDIMDILVLNNQNEILFSAKNSALAKAGSLSLTSSTDRENHFLIDTENTDIYFRLLKNDSLYFLKTMIDNDTEIKQGYDNDYFYEANFSSKKVYLLSYIVDKASGDKIYFISDIQPVQNGDFYLKAAAALAVLFFMLYWVLTALWVYANARKSKLNAASWGIITLLTNLAGLFIFLIYKQGNQTCYKCGAVQSKANIYCTFCGTKISRTCDNCHSVTGENDSYCKNCGCEVIKK